MTMGVYNMDNEAAPYPRIILSVESSQKKVCSSACISLPHLSRTDLTKYPTCHMSRTVSALQYSAGTWGASRAANSSAYQVTRILLIMKSRKLEEGSRTNWQDHDE
jgi:hypothetical protein